MKQRKIDLSQTIEQLENNNWGVPASEMSFLVRRTYELRKKKLIDLEIEDLRLLINQNIALPYILSLALQVLQDNIMAEGDYYEGDLLFAALTVEDNYWLENQEEAVMLKHLYVENSKLIEEFDTTDEIKSKLMVAFEEFSQKV